MFVPSANTSPHGLRRYSGFTLLELSIVLLIISITIGSGFAIANRVEAQKKIDTTNTHLDIIEKALLAYRTAYNRLPCPADGSMNPGNAAYGIEAGNLDPNNANCAGTPSTPAANFTAASHVTKRNESGNPLQTRVTGGMVPVTTLGLDKKYALDGYGNKISYHVDAQATESAAFTHYTSSNAKCFDVVIDDQHSDQNYLAFHAIYALLSHGADGHGAFSLGGPRLNRGSTNTFQNTNSSYSAAGASTPYTNQFFAISHSQDPANPANSYDDVVRFKTRNDLRTAQDSPAYDFPDLAVSTYGSDEENGWHIYFRCKDRFVMEDTSLVYTDSLRIFNFRFSPNNEFMAAGTGPTTSNHFELWTYDGFKTDKLPNSSFDPRNLGEAQSLMWANDSSFFIVSSLDGTNLTGCSTAAGCNRIRIYERTGPRTFVSKDRAIENVLAAQCNPTVYGTSGAACAASNTYILGGNALIQQISPDNEQLILANNMGASGVPKLYKRMPDNTFKHVPDAFNPPIVQISTNWPVWTPDMRYLFFPGVSGGTNGWNEIMMYRNDGNFRYSRIDSPTTPSPTSTYGSALTSANGSARAASFSPNGRFLATSYGGANGGFRIFELKNGDRWERIPLANIVTRNANSIDTSSKVLVGSSGASNARAERVEFSPDGRYLAVGLLNSGTPNKKVLIFRIEGNTFTLLDGPNEGPMPDISALPGNRYVTAIAWRSLMPWEKPQR